MPSPFTPPYYNFNIPYSGDGSFMHLLGIPPHVPFMQPHTGSQYVRMVQPLSLIALVVEVNRVNMRKKISQRIELNRLSWTYKHREIQVKIEYVRFA
ncbi:hypothetical protein Sjap_011315 [Stephania japonica]|uniref:Uncharacterized protein n=1 Tax=Stephania japonica TaxID=461633 RepID=A0AAP0JBA2_9MAGN